jgi:hypothetical protein
MRSLPVHLRYRILESLGIYHKEEGIACRRPKSRTKRVHRRKRELLYLYRNHGTCLKSPRTNPSPPKPESWLPTKAVLANKEQAAHRLLDAPSGTARTPSESRRHVREGAADSRIRSRRSRIEVRQADPECSRRGSTPTIAATGNRGNHQREKHGERGAADDHKEPQQDAVHDG